METPETPVGIGTMVHYVRADGPEHAHGACVPALVVGLHRDGSYDLAVAEPGTESAYLGEVHWALRERVPHAAAHRFGSWHPAG